MDAVETRYVRSETGWIAYQVVGSGPVDVVVVRPTLFPIDLMRWPSVVTTPIVGLRRQRSTSSSRSPRTTVSSAGARGRARDDARPLRPDRVTQCGDVSRCVTRSRGLFADLDAADEVVHSPARVALSS